MKYKKHIAFLALIAAISFYLVYTTYLNVEEELTVQLNNEQLLHAKQAAFNLEYFFNSYQYSLGYLSKNKDVIEFSQIGRDFLFNFYYSHANEIKAVTRIDSTGTVIFSVPFNNKMIGKNISAQEHVQRLLSDRKPIISKVFRAVQGYASIAFYLPVFKNNKFDGGLAVLIPFEELSHKILKDINPRDKGFAWLINQDGEILTSPVAEYHRHNAKEIFRRSPSALNFIDKALVGHKGSGSYYDDMMYGRHRSGENLLAVYYPIKIADRFWSVIIATPKSGILDIMWRFSIKWIIFFGLMLALAVIYIYYIIKAVAVKQESDKNRQAKEEIASLERKLIGLTEVSPDAIVIINKEGEIISMNERVLEIFGYKTQETVLRKNFANFVVPEEKERISQDFLNIRGNGILKEKEYNVQNREGKIFPVEVSAISINDGTGENNIWTVVLKDITTRKATEKAIIEAKENAEKSDRLKSEFLAQMSHEIRTPINIILSFTSLLRDELKGNIDEDLTASFSIIGNAGKRLIRTIDLILNMSEMQTGSYEGLFKDINLISDVLTKIVYEFSYVAKEKGLKLLFIYPREAENLVVKADEYTIGQIFSNLLDNAIKFTKQGEVEIRMELADSKLLVKIIDSGIGIAAEYIPNLFNPFSQEEQGYTRKYEGNGLGLALVNKYCELNNISIKVESEKGKGTVFTVVFDLPHYGGE